MRDRDSVQREGVDAFRSGRVWMHFTLVFALLSSGFLAQAPLAECPPNEERSCCSMARNAEQPCCCCEDSQEPSEDCTCSIQSEEPSAPYLPPAKMPLPLTEGAPATAPVWSAAKTELIRIGLLAAHISPAPTIFDLVRPPGPRAPPTPTA